MKRARVVMILLLGISYSLGWFQAKEKFNPKPQLDTRTELQKRLFRPGVTERTVYLNPALRDVGWKIRTDGSGSISVFRWSLSNDDKEEWIADSEGRVREIQKSMFGGYYPTKTILNDGVFMRIEYQERPSGIARVNWEVTIRPSDQAIQGAFDRAVEFLAQSRDT